MTHDQAIMALWHADENPKPEANRRHVEWALQRLADGHHDADDMEFVQRLAQCMLAAVAIGGTKGGQRAHNVLKASGLWGRPGLTDADDALEIARALAPEETQEQSVETARKIAPEAMRRVHSEDAAEALLRKMRRKSHK